MVNISVPYRANQAFIWNRLLSGTHLIFDHISSLLSSPLCSKHFLCLTLILFVNVKLLSVKLNTSDKCFTLKAEQQVTGNNPVLLMWNICAGSFRSTMEWPNYRWHWSTNAAMCRQRQRRRRLAANKQCKFQTSEISFQGKEQTVTD